MLKKDGENAKSQDVYVSDEEDQTKNTIFEKLLNYWYLVFFD